MISKTKYAVNEKTIKMLFENAGIVGATNIIPLGAGEYNSVYSVVAEDGEYAIKIAPLNNAGVLTYEMHMMEQEVYYYELMRDKAGISVPKVYYSDFSKTLIPTDYFIMDKLTGKQLNKARLTSEEMKTANIMLAHMVADMHSVKGEKFGYRQNMLFDNWYLAIVSIIENLLKDCINLGEKAPRGEKLLQYVRMNKAVLEKVESSLINFDIWSPNIFCTKDKNQLKLSWIDPERCLWGDRIADFVCLDFMYFSLDKKTNVIEAYNDHSNDPITIGYDERVRFAIMLGYLGIILDVEKYARYSIFHKGYWRNVFIANQLYSKCFSQLDNLNKE